VGHDDPGRVANRDAARELIALRWEDVDLVAGRIVVRQNCVGGVIGTPWDARVLRARCRRLKVSETRHPMWRACKRAGLRQITWHVLRQTFASHLVIRGATMSAVQELLGHASIVMTMRYAHPQVVRETVRLLDGLGRELAEKQKTASK
jgi:integrase